MSMFRHLRLLSLMGVAAVVASCADGLGPAAVAGNYVPQSVNGSPVPVSGVNRPIRGSLRLTFLGTAERRVTYAIDQQGTEREVAAAGTFEVSGTELRLSLQEGTYVWRVSARVGDGVVVLSYPNPADGPDIEEVYRR